MGGSNSRERNSRPHGRNRHNMASPPANMPAHLANQYNNRRQAANNNNNGNAAPTVQQQQQQQAPTTGNNDANNSNNNSNNNNNNNSGNNRNAGRDNQRGVQEGQIVKMLATIDASSVKYNSGTHILQFTVVGVCPSLTYEIHTGVKEYIKEGEVVYMPNKPKMEPPRISLEGTQESRVITVPIDVSRLDEKESIYNKHYPKQQPCVIVLRYRTRETRKHEDRNANATSTNEFLEHTEHTAVDLAASPKRRVISQIVTTSGSAYVVENLFGVDGETLGVAGGSPEVMLGTTIASQEGEDNEDVLCVICLTLPKDTAVMPCRHMCLCKNCAEELMRHTPKCPVCRGLVSTLLHMPVLNNGH